MIDTDNNKEPSNMSIHKKNECVDCDKERYTGISGQCHECWVAMVDADYNDK